MKKYIALVTNGEGGEINPTTYYVLAETVSEVAKTILDEDDELPTNTFSDIVEGQEAFIDECGMNIVVYSIDKAECKLKEINGSVFRMGKLDW